MNIRDMIDALRKIGFSEEAIAFGAQVHKSTISRIVTGKIASPGYVLVGRVERLFISYCK